MKTYKGQELIKGAKYLQKMGIVRSEIEKEFTLDSIDVEDRKATVHYAGTVEGEAAKLDVTVYNAKSYGNDYVAYIGDQRFTEAEYNNVYIWLHSITKLDTEDAKTGKLRLLPEQWMKVHRDFMKKFFKDFHIPKCKQKGSELYVEFPYLRTGSYAVIDSEFGMILLEYDPALRDFKKCSDNYCFDLGIGISNDTKTLALGYNLSSWYRETQNDAFKAVLPMAKEGHPSILNCSRYHGCHYVEGTYDEILEICNGIKERLFAHYDEIIKNRGGNPNWRSAITWEESGPVYPADSEESIKVKAQLEAKENALKKASIERVANVVDDFFHVDIRKLFDNQTIECNDYCFADSVTIKAPYKFPKIKGSKVVMQDKVLEINLYRDDYPSGYGDSRYNKLTVTYSIPAVYGTMSGEYVRFEEALIHDAEKLMILKTTKKKGKVHIIEERRGSNESVFEHIKNLIEDLGKYLKYKGYDKK